MALQNLHPRFKSGRRLQFQLRSRGAPLFSPRSLRGPGRLRRLPSGRPLRPQALLNPPAPLHRVSATLALRRSLRFARPGRRPTALAPRPCGRRRFAVQNLSLGRTPNPTLLRTGDVITITTGARRCAEDANGVARWQPACSMAVVYSPAMPRRGETAQISRRIAIAFDCQRRNSNERDFWGSVPAPSWQRVPGSASVLGGLLTVVGAAAIQRR